MAFEDINEKGLVKVLITNRIIFPLVVIGGGSILVIWPIAQSFKLNEDLTMIGLIVAAVWIYSRDGKADDQSKDS